MLLNKRLLFDNLAQLATALAEQFGPHCEVVVHDLAQPESSIVCIAGNLTGRSVGGPMTDFVLGLLKRDSNPDDVVGYTAHTRDGKTLKSSTIFIRDENGEPIGVFCVNFDVTLLLKTSEQLIELATSTTPLEVDKNFPADVPDLLQNMIQKSLQNVLKCDDMAEIDGSLSVEQRRAIIADLDAQGAFKILKATPVIAELFNVSRYTIYKDRNAIQE